MVAWGRAISDKEIAAPQVDVIKIVCAAHRLIFSGNNRAAQCGPSIEIGPPRSIHLQKYFCCRSRVFVIVEFILGLRDFLVGNRSTPGYHITALQADSVDWLALSLALLTSA